MLTDVWGNEHKTFIANNRGLILYQTITMGIKENDPLIAYAILNG